MKAKANAEVGVKDAEVELAAVEAARQAVEEDAEEKVKKKNGNVKQLLDQLFMNTAGLSDQNKQDTIQNVCWFLSHCNGESVGERAEDGERQRCEELCGVSGDRKSDAASNTVHIYEKEADDICKKN